MAGRIPCLQLIGRIANSGRSSRKYLLQCKSELLSLSENRPGDTIRAAPAGKTGIEIPPARSYGAVFSGAGNVAEETVGWGCSGMAAAAGAVMDITGKVSVCTVAGSSRSFR